MKKLILLVLGVLVLTLSGCDLIEENETIEYTLTEDEKELIGGLLDCYDSEFDNPECLEIDDARHYTQEEVDAIVDSLKDELSYFLNGDFTTDMEGYEDYMYEYIDEYLENYYTQEEVDLLLEENFLEIEVPVYETVVSRTLFETSDTDLIILVVSKGDTSYIIEFKYENTLLSSPVGKMIQIEKQINGEVIDTIFFQTIIDEENENIWNFEVLDYDDFYNQVSEILDETDEDLFMYMELIYEISYTEFYGIDLNLDDPPTIDQIVEFEKTYEGTLTLDNYSVIFELQLDVPTSVEITIETSADLDLNIYNNEDIYSLDWEDYLNYAAGSSTQTYDCLDGGIYYFEIENYHDYNEIHYKITFKKGIGDSA